MGTLLALRGTQLGLIEKDDDQPVEDVHFLRTQIVLGDDQLLAFSERPVLTHSGKVSADQARTIAEQHYETFDARRRETEALAAEAEDMKLLEELEQQAKSRKD